MFNEIFGLQGNTDIEQLALVIRTLGTPSTADWPEVKNLPDYNKIRCVRGFTDYHKKRETLVDLPSKITSLLR